MTIRQIVYLVLLVLFALGMAYGCGMFFNTSKAPTGLMVFLGMLVIFRPSLRLFILPNELFDPFTCFSKNDSAVFIKYHRIVFVSSMIVGCLMIFIMFALWHNK